MAKTRCIPTYVANKMKESIRNGDIDIADLYNMPSSEQRRKVFEQFASEDLARDINVAFEKAIVSKQKHAIRNWVEKTFTPKEKKGDNYKNILDKIDSLNDLGVLNNSNADSYFTDLIADTMGISMTVAEVQELSNKATKLEDLYSQETDDGIPSVEYWKARKEMDDYMASLVPSSRLKVFTSIIGRGNMLFSAKSPLVNIESNTVQGFFEGLARRISSKTYSGLNGDAVMSYVKKVHNIYQASGYDISRMTDIGKGRLVRGEEIVSSQGEGATRKIGQWYEDIVFKQLMGAPDVVSSAIAFADSANLSSTKIAQKNGGGKAEALAIFQDAMRIDPQTVEGKLVREQGIADATYSTWTNDGSYSKVAMYFRNGLNKVSGDIRLGDQLMPFIKTPANVVEAGIDAAGIGYLKGFYKLPEAMKELRVGNGRPMAEAVQYFVRSGLGTTLAAVLSHMFDPEDFIGEYESSSQKERDLVRLKKATYNSVRFGNRYVSLDYFGPIASAFVGMMYARKYGTDIPSSLFQYVRGVGSQALKVPGIMEFSEVVEDVRRTIRGGDIQDVGEGFSSAAIGYMGSRTIPAIVSDVAKGTDTVERETSRDAVAKIKSKIPGVRQSLPEKISQLTGKPVESQGFLNSILFGSRIKDSEKNDVIDEFTRLNNEGFGPAVSDIRRAGRFKELKDQIDSKKYQEAIKYFGENYFDSVNRKIKRSSYKRMDDEDKKKEIDKIRSDTVDKTLDKFRYRKPRKARTK